ncbi:MAG: nucleotidyltransferase [Planctomycetes bacterium]|nr:nucleotidyltransferase [Planctomycetota bacterium]
MEDLIRIAHEFEQFCKRRDWRFCFIGGLALQYWGRPRLTRDVDLCLLAGFGGEEAFIDPLLAEYTARVEDAREFALTSRVLLLATPGGIALDVSLGGIPFEERMVERACEVEYLPGVNLRICSAEDLIVQKAFADRLQDWADVDNVLRRRRDSLDWDHIERELQPLCEMKEAPMIIERLQDMRRG